MPTIYALTLYHLPFIILVSIIGYEISGYYLYLYWSHKKEGLRLNKILLAYGILYGFSLGGAALRTIATYYLSAGVFQDNAMVISHILIATAVISFQAIISSKDFNDIFNIQISRAILIESIVISTLLLLFQSPDLQLLLIIIAAGTGITYIAAFHYRLIKHAQTPIKKRLKLIVFGDGLMLLGIFEEAREILAIFPSSFHSFMIFTAAPIIFIGLLFVIFGLFQFPVFLEFEWKENLLAFFVIESKSNKLLYSFDFSSCNIHKDKSKEQSYIDEEKELFFSKGLSGIESVTSFITNSEAGKIGKIKQGNLLIQLIYGEEPVKSILYVLLVKKEMNSSTYFLKDLMNHFLTLYKSVLRNFEAISGSEEGIFSHFSDLIIDLINNPESEKLRCE